VQTETETESDVITTDHFNMGKMLAERGDFLEAESLLEPLANDYLEDKNYQQFIEVESVLLRIYGELERFDKINAAKERLQDLVIRSEFQLNSRMYYVLGVCAALKEQTDVAHEYFQQALKLGLDTNIKKDICHAIYGMAWVYRMREQYDNALKEIYNLQVFFELIDIPDLKVSSLILNGNILRSMGKYDQALDVYWQAYDLVKESKHLYMYIRLLFSMGYTYLLQGETSMGKVYLNLAKRSIDPKNNIFMGNAIDRVMDKYADISESEFDLVLDEEAHQLLEKKKGKVDFKSQFILLDLLKLFMSQPGQVFSKEALVEKVWKQEYDPRVHDNKVYVTIKRLRKLIEPDYDRPKYIFRSKQGYYLNKSAKVMVHH
tara:strand:- start:43411 stop:44535 length:1125 start_codon:yes stop_codon:yes gene_type:complete